MSTTPSYDSVALYTGHCTEESSTGNSRVVLCCVVSLPFPSLPSYSTTLLVTREQVSTAVLSAVVCRSQPGLNTVLCAGSLRDPIPHSLVQFTQQVDELVGEGTAARGLRGSTREAQPTPLQACLACFFPVPVEDNLPVVASPGFRGGWLTMLAMGFFTATLVVPAQMLSMLRSNTRSMRCDVAPPAGLTCVEGGTTHEQRRNSEGEKLG